MQRNLILLFISLFIFTMCNNQNEKTVEQNPFFTDYQTVYGVPPFDEIENQHFMPAFERSIQEHQKEITAIAESTEKPTFENTILAYERSGQLLEKVGSVFFNLSSSHTNDTLQEIARKISPMLSKHRDDISLNEALFARVQEVYDQKESLDLTAEQKQLLEKKYKSFVRSGASLPEEKKENLREINQKLSELSVAFGQNLLKENNNFLLVIEDEADLSGLPESVIAGAAETAKEKGHEGKWAFTLDRPSITPFLQYADNRELRKEIFLGYTNKGNNDNEYDNKEIAAEMASLRAERAALLGYPTHAHYILEENMAKTPDNVMSFLDRIMDPALKVAKKEVADLQAMADEEGANISIEPWDWWYYAEKVRKAKYDLDESEVRPYFELTNVRNGVFEVTNRLFGLTFEERNDIPKYHEDVQVFEVKEANGDHVGILYMDFFPRPSKRGGAWMSSFRKQSAANGEKVTPVITTNFNFTKPSGDQPALLSFDEVTTTFHEFGHALHGLLSNCTYNSLSGTSVPRDFVELPSQIMENWATEPEVLALYAKHYETGEVIPQEIVDKLNQSKHFNTGFATVEYLSAAYLDMAWHTLEKPEIKETLSFENEALEACGLIPQIVVRYRSPYFSHVFSGGYSSGYYSYVWAEILDADAFNAFKETDLFDAETAKAFRENILERGGTEDPMVMYKKFRGNEPAVEPLLERKGLL